MKKKRKLRALRKQALSTFLAFSLVAPQTFQIAAFAAETIENTPRRVDFSEPESLTLEELGIATYSKTYLKMWISSIPSLETW